MATSINLGTSGGQSGTGGKAAVAKAVAASSSGGSSKSINLGTTGGQSGTGGKAAAAKASTPSSSGSPNSINLGTSGGQSGTGGKSSAKFVIPAKNKTATERSTGNKRNSRSASTYSFGDVNGKANNVTPSTAVIKTSGGGRGSTPVSGK